MRLKFVAFIKIMFGQIVVDNQVGQNTKLYFFARLVLESALVNLSLTHIDSEVVEITQKKSIRMISQPHES